MDVLDKDIWKIPRVWFYCNSTLYVRLLSDALQDLRVDGAIRTPWQVKVAFSDEDNLDTAFSIRPDLAGLTDITLAQLQQDVRTISERLEEALRLRGQKILGAIPT